MKILFATDGSESAIRAANFIVELTRTGLELQITIMTVVPMTKEMAGFLGLTAERYNELSGIRVLPIFHRHEKVFKDFNIHYDCVVDHGDIAKRIVEKSSSVQYDQIILGSSGRNKIKRLLFGSVSQRVKRLAKCPVIVVN